MAMDDAKYPSPVGARSRTLAILAGDPSAGQAARWLVRHTMYLWGLEALADDVELCAAELLANAATHAVAARGVAESRLGQRITLVLRACPSRLFLEVSDGDSNPLPLPECGADRRQRPPDGCPAERAAKARPTACDEDESALLATHGRGLRIVQALADEVSWQPRAGGGKTVSARFDTTAPAA